MRPLGFRRRRLASTRRAARLALAVSGAWLVVGAPGPARAAEPPPLPRDEAGEPRSLDALWYDGRGRFFVASPGAVHLLEAEAAPISWPVDVAKVIDADGYAGRTDLVAMLGADGRVVRYEGEGWAIEQLELDEGETTRLVAIDGSAAVYVVTDRNVHVWARDRVKAYALPDEAIGKVRAATASAGGRLYLSGDGGLLLRFDGKLFERIIPAGASEKSLAASWSGIWLSADGHRLYARAGEDRVLLVDTRDGSTREYTLPRVEGTPVAGGLVAGESLASRDVVVATMGDQVLSLERDRFTAVGRVDGDVRELVVATDAGRGHALADGAIASFPLEPPPRVDASGPLDPEAAKRLDGIWRRDSRRDTRGPYAEPALFVPSIDVRLGPTFALHAAGEAPVTSLALDAGAGVVIAPRSTRPDPIFWLWPQAGYALDTHPRFGHHALYVANGFGFGSSLVSYHYTPGFLVGQGRDAVMGGFRHGLSVQALWGAVGVEARHQVERVGGRTQQTLGLMFSFNLAPLIWLPIAGNLR